MIVQDWLDFWRSMTSAQRADCVNVMDIQLATDTTGTFETLTDTTLIKSAMTGDIVASTSPAAVNKAATSSAWTRTVTITLKNAAGAVHTWFTGTIASACSIDDTSTAGTASIPNTSLVFTAGVATKVVSGDAQAWLAAETDTLSTGITLLGFTVPVTTSVQTWTAA